MAFQAPAVIAPLAIDTPEITEGLADSTFIVPPIKALPVIPKPPKTVNAAAVFELAFVPDVTANPDKLTNPELGFITKVAIVDKPKPVPFEVFTAVMENCELTTVGATATEDAAAGGTACQDGRALLPFDVSTWPLVAPVVSLDQVVVVLATIKSPTATGPCKPVPP